MRKCVPIHFLLILAISLPLGCDSKPARPVKAEKVSVLATVYPLADVARQVGGAHVEVSWVVEGGQSLSGVPLTPEVRAKLRSVNLVISGGATEPWAVEGFDDPFQNRRVVRMDALDASPSNKPSGGYLWLDPLAVKELSRELCNRLMALRPRHEMELTSQTNDFIARLEALVEEYQPKLYAAQNRKVMVLSSDFNPLLHRFGLVAVPTVSVSPMQLDASAMRTIQHISRQNTTRLLLVPSDTPNAVVKDIEVRGGLQIVRIDSLGSSAAGGHNSYLEMLRYDLEQLVKATVVR